MAEVLTSGCFFFLLLLRPRPRRRRHHHHLGKRKKNVNPKKKRKENHSTCFNLPSSSWSSPSTWGYAATWLGSLPAQTWILQKRPQFFFCSFVSFDSKIFDLVPCCTSCHALSICVPRSFLTTCQFWWGRCVVWPRRLELWQPAIRQMTIFRFFPGKGEGTNPTRTHHVVPPYEVARVQKTFVGRLSNWRKNKWVGGETYLLRFQLRKRKKSLRPRGFLRGVAIPCLVPRHVGFRGRGKLFLDTVALTFFFSFCSNSLPSFELLLLLLQQDPATK